ncbi:hypothetical protein NQ317_018723 [Molorchus minor]|uniref:Big brain n=1 Tax=Molorchus minor TaxID=1323400 RepID=A0ABQ9JRA7_9CUCU|nr:hypothetical protein NQ317_018723 [Molorchus minor]
MDSYRKWIGTSSLTIGSTYAACSFVSMPYLNPARSLGPSFVLNKWDNHWVYWLGPLLGGIASGLFYEYIFNQKRLKKVKETHEDESSSMNSDEIDNYGDLDKPEPPKFEATYSNYRSNLNGGQNYCASVYSAPASKLETGESLYAGTKSLYCNSPPLTRANLNRSQSVYAKSNSGINKDILPKPGPLVPTQSMYPLRINHQSHIQNQNVQNQLQQRSESSYGVRGITPGLANRTESHATTERQRDNYLTAERQRDNYSTNERPRRDNYSVIDGTYGTRNNPSSSSSEIGGKFEDGSKVNRGRPESMYGMLAQARRVQSAQSDDSNYNAYTANSSSRNAAGSVNNASYHNSENRGNYLSKSNYSGPPIARSLAASENRPNQTTNANSYHHQHSPNPQY